MNRYLEHIVDKVKYSGKIIDVSINFNNNKGSCKMNNYYILLTFLLVTILFLMTVTICYYCINYCSKQECILPY